VEVGGKVGVIVVVDVVGGGGTITFSDDKAIQRFNKLFENSDTELNGIADPNPNTPYLLALYSCTLIPLLELFDAINIMFAIGTVCVCGL
jgi:hypothetical protein